MAQNGEANDPTECKSADGGAITLSKNQQRKLARLERMDAYKAKRRMRQKEIRRAKQKESTLEKTNEDGSILKRREIVAQLKQETRLKLLNAQNNSPKICIDLAWDTCMNEREMSHLSDHIQRVYGINKKSSKPLHLAICSFVPGSDMYEICVKKHHGFLNYVIDFHDKQLRDVFNDDKIVYLTPDSKNTLTTLDCEKVYVLGGLVDLSVKKNQTFEFAQNYNLQTAALPILEYMEKDRSNTRHTYKRILSINQVFEILLCFYETNCWKTALGKGMPKRNGYLPTSYPGDVNEEENTGDSRFEKVSIFKEETEDEHELVG